MTLRGEALRLIREALSLLDWYKLCLVFMQTMSRFIFLVNSTSVSQVWKKNKFQNFSSRWIRNRSFHLKIWVWSSLYMSCRWSCYLRWIMSRQGFRYSTVHGSPPVFSEAEVNPAKNITYSEHRLDDIHGNTSGEPFEGSIFCLSDLELMTDKVSEVLFLFLNK